MSAMNFRGLDLDQNINERCLNSWQDYRGQSFQARMMKAARVHQFAKPLKIEEVPIPTPGPEDVVVRINASGHLHPAGTAWLYDACGRCEFCETCFHAAALEETEDKLALARQLGRGGCCERQGSGCCRPSRRGLPAARMASW
jgi:hypothetical protein